MPLTPVIDHAVINVNEQLDRACALFQRMGFQLSTRGHHSMGSSNHLAIFGDNYLELLGYEPERAPGKRGLWQTPPGLAGLVWKTTDAQQVYPQLQRCGLDGEPPTAFSRPVTLPDGRQLTAKFCITRLNANAIDYGFSFFCQHLTPQAVWQPAWQQHPNSVQAMTAFVIMAEDPHAAIAPYARLFAQSPLEETAEHGWLLPAGTACLRVITPSQAMEEYRLPPERAKGTRMIALDFRVSSLSRLTDSLRHGDIAYQHSVGRVLVPEQQSSGLALRFSE
ncbi:VOC family protein [Musicola paradisiaca]|uniref:Glyoxalase-like domain-containing protein n=1 Tax=Musicola paradisiaca (strain Ech703) TaxID=579405 RepID=C6C510_MUSP7|nr:VOC family protein [Musicola paradisiaca]ACS85620.1 conserved hypothetical protein [Musicola paradisiaca Ech703]